MVSLGLVSTPLSADPLIHGKPSTISAAEASTPYPVYQPHTAFAGGASLGSVWTAAPTSDSGRPMHEVALYYPSSGVQIIERPTEFTSPSAEYAAWQREFRTAKTSIMTINGVPAFTIEQGTDPSTDNPASVHIVLGGVYIQVVAYRPVNDLETVAGSLVAPAGAAN